jgi:hypothetical protein
VENSSVAPFVEVNGNVGPKAHRAGEVRSRREPHDRPPPAPAADKAFVDRIRVIVCRRPCAPKSAIDEASCGILRNAGTFGSAA